MFNPIVPSFSKVRAVTKILRTGVLLVGLMMPFNLVAQDAGSPPFSRFGWLEGTWERLDTRPGQTAYEEWTVRSDGLKGIGYTLQGSDTVFVEHLSIRRIEGELYYIAEVSHNAAPIRFGMTRITDSGFVSENPRHDYPKKIEYRLSGQGRLQAIISGDGRTSTFTFQKSTE